MELKLVACTPNALDILLNTKNTRMGGSRADEMTDAEKAEHLSYMLKTIKSSWEFVDYIFELTGVSRACTQQMERHRHGSFAEMTLRALDMSGAEFITPSNFDGDECMAQMFSAMTDEARHNYSILVNMGAQLQDARAVLPLSTSVNLTFKFNLRSIHEAMKIRLCPRTQGETQKVFRLMRERILEVHPWAEPFMQVACVADGACAFEKYGKAECRFWDDRLEHTQLKADLKAKYWAEEMQQANPVANNGVSMK